MINAHNNQQEFNQEGKSIENFGKYIVKRGDTMTEIAVKTGRNLQELVKENPQIKNPNKIYVGQHLNVGGRTSDYTVKRGDTLKEIAKEHKVSVGDILRANPGQIANRNLIYPGQKLNIPVHAGETPTAKPPTPKQTPPETNTPPSKPQPPVSTKPSRTTPPKETSVPTKPQTNTANNSAQNTKVSSHLKLKSKSIELSQLVKGKMSQVAEGYFKRTGKDLVITDGNRTAHDQAERIYDKIIARGESIYTNKAAIGEIKTAYNQAKAQGKSRAEIVNEMARVMQNQMNRGVYISKHLTGQGADVQIKFMSPQDREAFKQSIKTVGGARILNEGNHWHVEVEAKPTATKTTIPPSLIRQTPPTPKGDLKLGVNEQYHDALLLAQKRTNIDAAAIASVINAEAARDKSGKWIANSQASTSKAQGLTQFIPKTWEDHAKTRGTLLNEVALQMGYIQENNGEVSIVNHIALLALRNDPTLSIVSGAEFGKDNLAKLERSGFLPKNISDDEKAKYMYYAHHEGFAGATRFLTDSKTADEATTERVLAFNLKPSTIEAMKQKYGSYKEAYEHFAESEAKRIFPIQVGSKGTAIMNSYAQKYGSYERGYHAWLKDYTDKKIQPNNYRK